MAGSNAHEHWFDSTGMCECGAWTPPPKDDELVAARETIARLQRAAAVFTRIHGQCDGCRYCEVEVSLRGADGGERRAE